MKIGALIRCYHLTRYLKAILKSLDYLDEVLVVNAKFKGTEDRPDATEDIVRELGQKNVTLLKEEHDGEEQHEIIRAGLEVLWGCKYVFINDADEFILRKDREEIVEQMATQRAEVGFCHLIDYVSEPFHIPQQHYPFRGHRPTVIVKPSTTFYNIRNIRYGNGIFFDKCVHHFGYTWNSDDMNWKHSFYEEAESKDLKDLTKRRKFDCKVPDEIMKLLEE